MLPLLKQHEFLDRGMPLCLARRAAAGLDRMSRDDTLASVLAQLDAWSA
jgi:hypothetical protein